METGALTPSNGTPVTGWKKLQKTGFVCGRPPDIAQKMQCCSISMRFRAHLDQKTRFFSVF